MRRCNRIVIKEDDNDVKSRYRHDWTFLKDMVEPISIRRQYLTSEIFGTEIVLLFKNTSCITGRCKERLNA